MEYGKHSCDRFRLSVVQGPKVDKKKMEKESAYGRLKRVVKRAMRRLCA